MKTIRTTKESCLTYTANGIKGKNGEIISTFGESLYRFGGVAVNAEQIKRVSLDRPQGRQAARRFDYDRTSKKIT